MISPSSGRLKEGFCTGTTLILISFENTSTYCSQMEIMKIYYVDYIFNDRSDWAQMHTRPLAAIHIGVN